MAGKAATADRKYCRGEAPSLANKTGAWRLMAPYRRERLSPCRQACGLKGAVPRWLEAVKRERWDRAWEIMSEYNPFPAITGYVCFHPCMDRCNRRELEEAVDIQAVERAVGLWRLERYRPPVDQRETRGRVAVVGSGPAGLSCAYYLNRDGYRVTVLEKAPVAGGMLALGIPEYRLPRRVLSRELEVLALEGIEFQTGCAVGADLPLSALVEQYDRVFLATGAWKARPLTLPGADLPGVISALDFLGRVNRGEKVSLSDPVLVIGGGNAAVDAARMALRQEGIKDVTIVYRRSRAEMPAFGAEVDAAERDGVKFIFNAAPREVREGGGFRELLLDSTESAGGLVRIIPGEPRKINCATLIYAIGQEPDPAALGRLEKPLPLFAGGDLVTGPATVPEAINAGRVAAAAIAAQLERRPEKDDGIPAGPPVSFEELHLAMLDTALLPGKQADPALEAARCLGCGTCNSCGICRLFCPDVAVRWEDEQYFFDLDYCKGCGICARECPARVLVMEGGDRHAH